MKVLVYKDTGKGAKYVVVPGRKAHKAPQTVQGTDRAKARQELAAVLAGLYGETPQAPT